jgi:hypothetical protein
MLSSPRLQKARFPALVPINTLVVDEASQIQVHGYLPALNDYVRTIRKICFIGDDKQRTSDSILLALIMAFSHGKFQCLLMARIKFRG